MSFQKSASVDLAEGRDPFATMALTAREEQIVAMISRGMTTVLVDGLRCAKYASPDIRETRVAEAIALMISKMVEQGNAEFQAQAN